MTPSMTHFPLKFNAQIKQTYFSNRKIKFVEEFFKNVAFLRSNRSTNDVLSNNIYLPCIRIIDPESPARNRDPK